MAGKELYTAKQMADALIASNGMKTIAARNLGCDYNTIVRYINKYKSVAVALDLSKQRMGDRLESTALAMALGKRSDDNESWIQEPNTAMLIFLMKVHPTVKERGYTERYEVTGKDGTPVQHNHTVKFSNLSDDELDNLIQE